MLKITGYIRWTRVLSTISRASLKLRKYVFIIQNMESGRHSIYIWKEIPSGFHTRKNPKQQYLKVVMFSDASFSKKYIYVYDQAASIIQWTDHPVHEKVLILGKTRPVCFRDHSHIDSFHNLHQIDVSGWMGLALWC